jgi:hypothetical protein
MIDSFAEFLDLADLIVVRQAEQQIEIERLQQNVRTLTAQYTNLQDVVTELRERAEASGPKPRAAPARLTPRGDIPVLGSVDKIWCQIWYRDDLTPADRKNKTDWSIKFEVFANGVRQAFDVALYTQRNFLKHADKLRLPMSDATRDLASEQFEDKEHKGHLVGMIRASPLGRGRPWSANQIVHLRGHVNDQPQVVLVVEGEPACFSDFRPGKGSEGASKWFGEWSPSTCGP